MQSHGSERPRVVHGVIPKFDSNGAIVSLDEEIVLIDRAVQMTDDVEDFLMHYGTKGMKWGVRKDHRSKSSRSSEVEKARAKPPVDLDTSGTGGTNPPGGLVKIKKGARAGAPAKGLDGSAYVLKRTPDDKSAHMSDEQLRTALNRLRMEDEYRKLTAVPERKSAGKEFVKKLLLDTGKMVATDLTKTYASHYAKKGLIKLGLPDVKSPAKPKEEKKDEG